MRNKYYVKKSITYISTLMLALLWTYNAVAKEPYPPGTSWEDFLHDEELLALNELNKNLNYYLTQFQYAADALEHLTTVLDTIFSSRSGDAAYMVQIISHIQSSEITTAYIEYKTLRRMQPNLNNIQAINFFKDISQQPVWLKSSVLANRQTLFRNHPKFRSQVAGERYGTHYFGEAPTWIFSNVLLKSGPKEQNLIESVFSWIYQKWGKLSLPAEAKPLPPLTTPTFRPAKTLPQARHLLSIAQRQTKRLKSHHGSNHWKVRDSQEEEKFYRSEVKRLSGKK